MRPEPATPSTNRKHISHAGEADLDGDNVCTSRRHWATVGQHRRNLADVCETASNACAFWFFLNVFSKTTGARAARESVAGTTGRGNERQLRTRSVGRSLRTSGAGSPRRLGRTRSERCTNMPKPNKPKTLAPPKHTNALAQQLNEHKHTRVSRPARGTEPQHNTALTPFRSGKRRGWLPLA